MSFSWTRVRAISVKELRDYRRNRFVVGTMTVLPLLFVILPLIQVFDAYAHVDSSNLNRHVGLSMLYMLLIPAFLPSTLCAYSVAGEREQGTLAPVLITRSAARSSSSARRSPPSFRRSSSPTWSLASSSPLRPCLLIR